MTGKFHRGEISKPIEGWTPTMGFLVGLCWDFKNTAERRSGFPSWSWTGWQSTVSWGLRYPSNWPAVTVDPNTKLSVECIDGQALSLEAFQESQNKDTIQLQMSSIIRITGWTIYIPIVSQTTRGSTYVYIAWLELEESGFLEWRIESPSKVLFESCQGYTGIFLDQPFRENDRDATIMVLIQKGEVYERVGLCQLSCYRRFNKDGKEVPTKTYDPEGFIIYEVNGAGLNPPTLSKSWKEVRLS